MVKLIYLLALLGLFACKSSNKNGLTDADVFMYSEYMDYVILASSGAKNVNTTLGVQKNLTYYYRDFPEEGLKFLMIYNKRLNQQYAIFYGYGLEKKRKAIMEASAVSGLNLGDKIKFNQEILKTFLKTEEFIEGKFQKGVKKIVIGFELGGSLANMATTSLIENAGFKSSEFEVITFGSIPFANNFNFNFNRVSIILEGDTDFYLSTKCCTQISSKKLTISDKKAKGSKLERYKQAMQNTVL
jgi:hypothetical protein